MRECRAHASRSEFVGADIALAGNPNVGKSCLFNQLTGVGAIVSNYPGTTVEIMEGNARIGEKIVRVADLPGTYALGTASEDERVAKNYLYEKKPRVIINVVDANLLERNLYLTLQLLETSIPVVVALNFFEEASDVGRRVNAEKLEEILGVPVVPVDALRGAGIHELAAIVGKLLKTRVKQKSFKTRHCVHIEEAVKKICKIVRHPIIPERVFALQLIENDADAWKWVEEKAREVKKIIEKHSKQCDLAVEVSRERHGQAALIAKKVVERKKQKIEIESWLDRVTTEPSSGMLIMILVLGLLFASLFVVGGFLEELVAELFEANIAPHLTALIQTIPNKIVQTMLEFAFVLGLEAALSIAIPYVLVFYFILAFLEDTGYLPRMAYLLDNWMHRMGLHGKAIVPMLLGFGCSVPAIIATRILPSTRERLITAILICLIPCSARTAIILGATGYYVGWQWAMLVYAITLVLMFSIGWILAKRLPGETAGLIIEMPKYRMPKLIPVMQKTWLRVKDFLLAATPLVIIGSAILGGLQALDLLKAVNEPLSPIINGWLLLPDVAGITLFYGVLRKELALEMLVALAGGYELTSFMSPLQIFIFSLVASIYVPCIATMAVLKNEFGWKNCLLISVGTILAAVLIGGVVARIILALGLLA